MGSSTQNSMGANRPADRFYGDGPQGRFRPRLGIQANLRGAADAPSISQLVGGVAGNMGMPVGPPPAVLAQPQPQPGPIGAPPPQPAYTGPGVGDVMRGVQQAQSTAAGGLSGAPNIADLVRMVRQMRGLG